ncbi:hypothetical protein [Beijerinckia indica]|nr:hypothetical protein [Beijerinckia indica]
MEFEKAHVPIGVWFNNHIRLIAHQRCKPWKWKHDGRCNIDMVLATAITW